MPKIKIHQAEVVGESQAVGQEMIRRGVALTSEVIVGIDPAFLMGALVREGELTLKMVAPPQNIIAKLRDDTAFVKDAEEFVIDGSDDFKIADNRQVALRDEFDELESFRKAGNGGLLGMKNAWDMLYTAGVNDRKRAYLILQNKMRAYESRVAEEAEVSRINAESAVEVHVENTELEIKKLREKASKAKGAKRIELESEANRLERINSLTPPLVSQQAPSIPQTGGSGRGKPWQGEVTDPVLFMCWILGIPKIVVDTLDLERVREEIAGVEYKQGMLNGLAKLATNTRKIPGFKAEQVTSYRRDPKRSK